MCTKRDLIICLAFGQRGRLSRISRLPVEIHLHCGLKGRERKWIAWGLGRLLARVHQYLSLDERMNVEHKFCWADGMVYFMVAT